MQARPDLTAMPSPSPAWPVLPGTFPWRSGTHGLLRRTERVLARRLQKSRCWIAGLMIFQGGLECDQLVPTPDHSVARDVLSGSLRTAPISQANSRNISKLACNSAVAAGSRACITRPRPLLRISWTRSRNRRCRPSYWPAIHTKKDAIEAAKCPCRAACWHSVRTVGMMVGRMSADWLESEL